MLLRSFETHDDAGDPVPFTRSLVADAVKFHATHDPVVGPFGEACGNSFHQCRLGNGFTIHEHGDKFDDLRLFTADRGVVLPGGRVFGRLDVFM